MSRGCMLELCGALCDPELRAAEQRLHSRALTSSVAGRPIKEDEEDRGEEGRVFFLP